MVKLKDIKNYYITIPKDYNLSKNPFLKNKRFLFAREEELKYFKNINKDAKCFLLNEIEGDASIILNNKIAYYEFIFKKLDSNKKVYLYKFDELDILNDNTYLHAITLSSLVIDTSSPIKITVLYRYLQSKGKNVFFINKYKEENVLQKLHLNDNLKKNNTIVLIPPNGEMNSIDFSLVRVSKFLRKKGKKTILLTISNNFDFYDDFDDIYLEDNIVKLINKLNTIEREYIFYRGWMHSYIFGALLVENFKNVIVYLKDWNFAPKKDYCFLFEDGEMDFIGIEKIFKKAKYVLSHFTTKEYKRWSKEYNVKTDKFIFFPELCSNLNIDVPKNRDKTSLVWAGTIPPTSYPEEFYISKDMYNALLAVTNKKINIDFVIPPSYYNGIMAEKKLYKDIIYQDSFNKYFNLKKGEALNANVIKNYSYGIFPLYIGKNKYKRLFEYAIPSKFAFYLEANLPIIVNKKMKALSEIVEENKIGIVISNRDLSKIDIILDEFKKHYDLMVKNVIKFKNSFTYDKFKLGNHCTII